MATETNPFTKTRGWSPKELIPLILNLGYEMTNGRGTHKKFTHPETKHSFTISAKPNMDRYDSKLVKTLRHVWDLQHGITLEPVKIENGTPLNLLQSCGLVSRLPSQSATPAPKQEEPAMKTPSIPAVAAATSTVPPFGKQKWFEWLKAVRVAAKIGTKDAADLMGWSTFTLAQVERGDRKLSQEEYGTFCLIFDIPSPAPTIPLEKNEATLQHRAAIKASMNIRFPKKVKAKTVEVPAPEPDPIVDPVVDVCEPGDNYVCMERVRTGSCACPMPHIRVQAPPEPIAPPAEDDVVAAIVAEYKELKDLITRAKAAEPRFADVQNAIRVISSLFPGRIDPFVVADVKAQD